MGCPVITCEAGRNVNEECCHLANEIDSCRDEIDECFQPIRPSVGRRRVFSNVSEYLRCHLATVHPFYSLSDQIYVELDRDWEFLSSLQSAARQS